MVTTVLPRGKLHSVFLAGGNLGGDEDHRGEAVIDGMLYVTRDVHDNSYIVAGPFDTVDEAEAWMVEAEGGHA